MSPSYVVFVETNQSNKINMYGQAFTKVAIKPASQPARMRKTLYLSCGQVRRREQIYLRSLFVSSPIYGGAEATL